MCIDMKISNQANKDKKKTKYEMGNFCIYIYIYLVLVFLIETKDKYKSKSKIV
jgi:predicted ferric reductase